MVTSDVREAEARGACLLSDYRLNVRRQATFNAQVNGVALSDVDMYYVSFGSSELDIASQALDDRFGIVIPLTGAMTVRYKRFEFDVISNSSALIISPDDEFRMRWSDGFASITIRVPKQHFAAFARSVAPGAEMGDLAFDPLIQRPAALRSLLGAVDVLAETVNRAGSAPMVPALLAGRVREQLVTTLLTMQPNDLVGRLYRRTERISERAVREAVDIVQAETASLPTVPALAHRVGVSVRTLQAGFQCAVGVTPASYIRKVRLTRAHAELVALEPGDGVTIAEIALKWGFHHPGRFAAYYRTQFGESPSDTLNSHIT
jgi:AraC-like DNA-binding protein